MRNHNCICATCCNAVRSLATPATAASYPFMMTATKITYHPYNRNENIIACCSRAAVTSACSPAARRHRCLPYSTQCCTVIFLIVIKRRRIRIDEVPSTTTRVPNGPTPLPRRPPIHAPSPPHPTRACACGWVSTHPQSPPPSCEDVGGREPLRRPRTRRDSHTIVAPTRARSRSTNLSIYLPVSLRGRMGDTNPPTP